MKVRIWASAPNGTKREVYIASSVREDQAFDDLNDALYFLGVTDPDGAIVAGSATDKHGRELTWEVSGGG